MKGKLYIIPMPIGNKDPGSEIPDASKKILIDLDYFIVENTRSCKRALLDFIPQARLDAVSMAELSEHTRDEQLAGLLQPLLEGRDGAIISEAGSPCIADPGAVLVSLAHARGIKVIPLPGPGSIFMALMASGLGGQKFFFKGYLPQEKTARANALRKIELESGREGATGIFIETPYRNRAMLESMAKVLLPGTEICIAIALSCKDEKILRLKAGELGALLGTLLKVPNENSMPDLGKRPAVFVIKAES